MFSCHGWYLIYCNSDVIQCRKIESVTLENVHFDAKRFIVSFITHKLIFEYINIWSAIFKMAIKSESFCRTMQTEWLVVVLEPKYFPKTWWVVLPWNCSIINYIRILFIEIIYGKLFPNFSMHQLLVYFYYFWTNSRPASLPVPVNN